MAGLKELVVTFEANASPVLGALRNVDSKLRGTSNKLSSLSKSFGNLGQKMTVGLTLPLGLFSVSSVKAIADMESLEATLSSVLQKYNQGIPITQAVANEIETLKDITNDLGVSFNASVSPYVKYLAASRDSLQTNRKVIKSFLGMSASLGLTADDTSRVIRALEQMQSKGQVMSEELKLQLGDAIPGALGLFSEAMGVTSQEFLKLMERGEVSSKILSKVADVINKKYYLAINKGSKGIRSSMNRVSNAFNMLRVNVGRGLEETFHVNEKMAGFADWLERLGDNFLRLDDTGKNILLAFGAILVFAGPLLIVMKIATMAFTFLSKIFIVIKTGIIALSSALMANPILLIILAIIAAIILVVVYWDDITEAVQKAYKWMVDLFSKIGGSAMDSYVKSLVAISEFWGDIVGFVKDAYNWMSKLSFGGISDSIKSFIGLDDVNINAGDAIEGKNDPSAMTRQSIMTNNLTVNIPAGTSASDAMAVKSAVKQAIQEENKQAYIELGVT